MQENDFIEETVDMVPDDYEDDKSQDVEISVEEENAYNNAKHTHDGLVAFFCVVIMIIFCAAVFVFCAANYLH